MSFAMTSVHSSESLTRMLGFARGSRKGSLFATPRPTRVKMTTMVVKANTSKITITRVRFNAAFGSSGACFAGLRDLKKQDNAQGLVNHIVTGRPI